MISKFGEGHKIAIDFFVEVGKPSVFSCLKSGLIYLNITIHKWPAIQKWFVLAIYLDLFQSQFWKYLRQKVL